MGEKAEQEKSTCRYILPNIRHYLYFISRANQSAAHYLWEPAHKFQRPTEMLLTQRPHKPHFKAHVRAFYLCARVSACANR
jgi:hypothetical protein